MDQRGLGGGDVHDLFDVVEADIEKICTALNEGAVTSVELVAAYVDRIARFDRRGELLNSVPQLNGSVFREAKESDERRRKGETLGRLDGIPYTAKDSYAVRGHSLAAGSPAFRETTASEDAFAIERLRNGGAIYLGRTNMPPMANGGMQRGLYGRAESPYNADYLTAAFASGSSNGSGTATAASFASFGLGEETWSSGRAPASNNGLVAYTPSRGVISVRGNWPLVPTMDVVVPHTRSVRDLLEVLDVVVADDADPTGDFWRQQSWVNIPAASSVRPPSYRDIWSTRSLQGVRLGVPKMYINEDVGSRDPIVTRASVIDLWERARKDLTELGAEVIEVEFPVVSNYERDREGALSMVDRGYVGSDFELREVRDLAVLWWDQFLHQFAATGPTRLADVEGEMVFPQPTGALAHPYADDDFNLADYPHYAKHGFTSINEVPGLEAGVRGLERTRQQDLEEWLTAEGLDAVVFPAVADVGPADADVNVDSANIAWRNGTWVANGNLVPRHLGIPTVTVPMGVMSDIGMPVGLSFAGAAYSDNRLLSYAGAFESCRVRRGVPPRTPRCDETPASVRRAFPPQGRRSVTTDLELEVRPSKDGGGEVRLVVPSEHIEVRVSVNGWAIDMQRVQNGTYRGVLEQGLAPGTSPHSEWSGPYGALVVAVTFGETGEANGTFASVGGVAGIDGPKDTRSA